MSSSISPYQVPGHSPALRRSGSFSPAEKQGVIVRSCSYPGCHSHNLTGDLYCMRHAEQERKKSGSPLKSITVRTSPELSSNRVTVNPNKFGGSRNDPAGPQPRRSLSATRGNGPQEVDVGAVRGNGPEASSEDPVTESSVPGAPILDKNKVLDSKNTARKSTGPRNPFPTLGSTRPIWRHQGPFPTGEFERPIAKKPRLSTEVQGNLRPSSENISNASTPNPVDRESSQPNEAFALRPDHPDRAGSQSQVAGPPIEINGNKIDSRQSSSPRQYPGHHPAQAAGVQPNSRSDVNGSNFIQSTSHRAHGREGYNPLKGAAHAPNHTTMNASWGPRIVEQPVRDFWRGNAPSSTNAPRIGGRISSTPPWLNGIQISTDQRSGIFPGAFRRIESASLSPSSLSDSESNGSGIRRDLAPSIDRTSAYQRESSSRSFTSASNFTTTNGITDRNSQIRDLGPHRPDPLRRTHSANYLNGFQDGPPSRESHRTIGEISFLLNSTHKDLGSRPGVKPGHVAQNQQPPTHQLSNGVRPNITSLDSHNLSYRTEATRDFDTRINSAGKGNTYGIGAVAIQPPQLTKAGDGLKTVQSNERMSIPKPPHPSAPALSYQASVEAPPAQVDLDMAGTAEIQSPIPIQQSTESNETFCQSPPTALSPRPPLPPGTRRMRPRVYHENTNPEKRRQELIAKHDPVAFDAMIYGVLNAPFRPSHPLYDTPPHMWPPRPLRRDVHFGHIDPRVQWAHAMPEEWHQDKQDEINARGGKKANWGKSVQRNAKRKAAAAAREREGEGRQDKESGLPERVRNNPEWLAAWQEIEEMKEDYRTEQRDKSREKKRASKEKKGQEKKRGRGRRRVQTRDEDAEDEID